MPTRIDQQLQHAAADVTEALADIASLTPTPSFQKALTELRERVESALGAHRQAVADTEQDASDDRLAALAFDETAARAVGVYRHLRARARFELVDLDPTEADALGPVELERRQRLYERAFAHAPSELTELGRLNVKAALQATLDQLDGADSGLTRVSLERLADIVDELDQHHARVRDEARDDAQLADRLFASRDTLARLTQTLTTAADALLRADNSPQTLDRLLQSSRKRRAEPNPDTPPVTPEADTPAPATPAEPDPVA